jgi:hypothetical protein
VACEKILDRPALEPLSLGALVVCAWLEAPYEVLDVSGRTGAAEVELDPDAQDSAADAGRA